MKQKQGPKTLSPPLQKELLGVLEDRFARHAARHAGVRWQAVRARLEADAGKLWSLNEMERTGGEPDVVGEATRAGEVLFVDCSAQSPKGRRSVCYDPDALETRKTHKPRDSAIGMAAAMGIELLTEAQYRRLQEVGEFDTTTSSWVTTPTDVRRLGGALFCDRRFGLIFVYHNGAES